MNGDGNADLAIANTAYSGSPSQNQVSVLLGNGDGTFQSAVNFPSGSSVSGIAAGDVTGDKIPDLVVTFFSSPTVVALFKGNGDGTFQSEQTISTDPSLGTSFVELRDLNNDNKLDLVMSSVLNNGAAILMGNGDGTFQPAEAYETGVQPYYFATTDVNGDQNVDLAVVDSEGNYVTVLLGNGDGTFSPRRNLPLGNSPANISSAVIADFDGDGKPDIAVSAQSGLTVLLGEGNGIFKQPLTASSTQGLSLSTSSAADFNHDGHLDLLAGGTTLLLGHGDGTFDTPVQINSDQNIRSYVLGTSTGMAILI